MIDQITTSEILTSWATFQKHGWLKGQQEVIVHTLDIHALRLQLSKKLEELWVSEYTPCTDDEIYITICLSEDKKSGIRITPIDQKNHSLRIEYIKAKNKGLLCLFCAVYYAPTNWVKSITLWVWPEKKEWITSRESKLKVRNIYEAYGFININHPFALRFDHAVIDGEVKRVNYRTEADHNPGMSLHLDNRETLKHLLWLSDRIRQA